MSVNPKYVPTRAERLFGKTDDSERLRKAREREQEIIRQRRMQQQKAPQK